MADDDADDLLDRVKRCYKEAREHQNSWREEARRDYDFYSGEQWDAESLSILQEQQRPAVVFNRLAPVVDAIVGFEINNRQETRFLPREMGDVQANETLTAAAEWVRDECDADTEESAMFRDAVVCGMGWGETRLTDEHNPEMDVVIERVDPLEMAWDPTAKKPNLTDARWLIRERFYTKDQFKSMFPGHSFDAEALKGWEDSLEDTAAGSSSRVGYQADNDNAKPDTREIRVWEYQWKESSTAYMAVNPVTGESEEMDKATLDGVVRNMPDLRYSKVRKTVVNRAFVAGGEVLEEGEGPDPERFTYVPVTGKYDRNRNLWYGVVRSLRDPQTWANKWLSQSMHILNTQAKGGVMAETSAVADRDEFEKSWTDSAAVTWVNPDAIKNGAIQAKPMAQFPAALDKLLELAIRSFPEVSGVNTEMMGMADRQQAGVLEYQRKQAAVTILAPLFDSLRRYRKISGRVLLHFITAYISDGRLIRIVGKESGDESYQPLNRTDDAKKYDVIVDQAATSPNEKERVFAILQQLLPMMKDMLTPDVMAVLLKYTPLPSGLLAQLQQMAQKPNPDAERMKQIQMRQEEAKAAKDEADAQATMMQGQNHQIDAALKLKELGIKEKELGIKEIELVDRADERAMNQQALMMPEQQQLMGQTNAVAEVGQLMAQALTMLDQRLGGALDGLQQQVGQIMQSVEDAKAMQSAPRQIVRGPDGRAVGVQVGGALRQITRGPDGRPIGIQ